MGDFHRRDGSGSGRRVNGWGGGVQPKGRTVQGGRRKEMLAAPAPQSGGVPRLEPCPTWKLGWKPETAEWRQKAANYEKKYFWHVLAPSKGGSPVPPRPFWDRWPGKSIHRRKGPGWKQSAAAGPTDLGDALPSIVARRWAAPLAGVRRAWRGKGSAAREGPGLHISFVDICFVARRLGVCKMPQRCQRRRFSGCIPKR